MSDQIIKDLTRLDELRKEIEADVIVPETYEKMISLLPVGVILINEIGKILLVNQAFETISGYTAPMIEGRLVHILLPPDLALKHPGLVNVFFDRPERRAMNQGRELPLRRANGKLILVRVDIAPLPTPLGWLAMATIQEVVLSPGTSGV